MASKVRDPDRDRYCETSIRIITYEELHKKKKVIQGLLQHKILAKSECDYDLLGEFIATFAFLTAKTISDEKLRPLETDLALVWSTIGNTCDEKLIKNDYCSKPDYRWHYQLPLLLSHIEQVIEQTTLSNGTTTNVIPLLLNTFLKIHVSHYRLIFGVPFLKKVMALVDEMKRRELMVDNQAMKDLTELICIISHHVFILNNHLHYLKSKEKHKEDTQEFDSKKVVLELFDNSLAETDKNKSLIANKTLKEMAFQRGINLQTLFWHYQKDINLFIWNLVDIQVAKNTFKYNFLFDCLNVFDIDSIPKVFLCHFIPSLMNKFNKELLNEFMNAFDEVDMSNIILPYLPEIFCHFFFNNEDDKMLVDNYSQAENSIEKLIQFLSEIFSQDQLFDEIKVQSNEIKNAFLMHLSEHNFNQVLQAFSFLSTFTEEGHENTQGGYDFNFDKFLSHQDLRNYLRPTLLGYFHKLDEIFKNNLLTSEEKLMFIHSLVKLIEIMGSEIVTALKSKLMTTLIEITSERNYNDLAIIKAGCQAWQAFIKTLNEEQLMAQISTISAYILPLIVKEICPEEAIKILEDMILPRVKKRTFFEAFRHLYFIPIEEKDFTSIANALKPFVGYQQAPHNMEASFKLAFANIVHENIKVREIGLKRLNELLNIYQTSIRSMCNKNGKDVKVDILLSSIVKKLMSSMDVEDETILHLIANCVGQLGALDPFRVDQDKPLISQIEGNSKFLIYGDDNEFKIALIKALMKTISSTDDVLVQNCSYYALQEIIKFYKIFKENGQVSPEAASYLPSLGTEVIEFCKILFTAKYSISKNCWNKQRLEMTQNQTHGVIFTQSNTSLTHSKWLKKWSENLVKYFIDKNEEEKPEIFVIESASQSDPAVLEASQGFMKQLKESLGKLTIPSQILRVSSLIIARDNQIAQFLLPFVVICAVKGGNKEERDIIIDEIKAVVDWKRTNPNFSDIHGCAQTIFNLYDYLKVWSKKRSVFLKQIAKTPRHVKQAFKYDLEFEGVEYLLSKISPLDLSHLAYDIKAYSRSLRYLEDYLRETPLETLDSNLHDEILQRQIPSFIKISVNMNEVDMIEGYEAKRSSGTSIAESVFIHEAKGKIQEALNICGKAIECNPQDFEMREKYLSISLMDLNQIDQVYNYGSHLMVKFPEWKSKTLPYVLEAAWKLNQWDDLDSLVGQFERNEGQSERSIGVGIGELLNVARKNSYDSLFTEKLKVNKLCQIMPLKAASNEIRGYIRSHQSIINLHLLYDIQTAIDTINNYVQNSQEEGMLDVEELKSNFKSQVLTQWQERLELVRKQVSSQEPILNTHRAFLSLLKDDFECLGTIINKEIFKTWLMSMRLSRKVGYTQRSYTCYQDMTRSFNRLEANDLDFTEISFMITEEAKLLWSMNQKQNAIKKLNEGIERHFKDVAQLCYEAARSQSASSSSGSSSDFSDFSNQCCIFSFASRASTNQRPVRTSTSTSHAQSMINTLGTVNDSVKISFAKMQLLLCKYSEEMSLHSVATLNSMYSLVTQARPDWEEGHFCIGMFYASLVKGYEENAKRDRASINSQPEMVNFKTKLVKSLAMSLRYGTKHLHTSLPKLMAIWLDLSADFSKLFGKKSLSANDNLEKSVRYMTNTTIVDLIRCVPPYIFLVVLDLIQSRLLHPSSEIRKQLNSILINLLIHFPKQVMWHLIRSNQSFIEMKKSIFNQIISGVRNRLTNEDKDQLKAFNKTFQDMTLLANELIKLCVHKIKHTKTAQEAKLNKAMTISFGKHCPEIVRLISKSDSSRILIPIQAFMRVNCLTHANSSSMQADFNPFSNEVYIQSIEDQVEVMQSLQQPKKLTVKGTDGNKYILFLKSGDDLRKDASILDFHYLLNKLFAKDCEARKRHLKVNIYYVTSLSGDCGLIEFVPNLSHYRKLVETLYKSMNKDYEDNVNNRTKFKRLLEKSRRKEEKIQAFMNHVLPNTRPVFDQWFIQQFTDPYSWFLARISFARSTAIFSMVGFLYGLGDRHGENLMVDTTSGEMVHVDYNCLFNKGETFEVPERVPFRLTQNMVKAMGPAGYEGAFRKTSEITLKIIRKNKDAMMNIVYPLKYEPLYEWFKENNEDKNMNGYKQIDFKKIKEEVTVACGDICLDNLEARLDGMVDRNSRRQTIGLKRSVEGQVDFLIRQATNVELAAQMYYGWASWI